MKFRSGVHLFGWSVVMMGSFFLPVFLIAGSVTRVWLGYPFASAGVIQGLADEASGSILAYFGMIFPLLPGVAIYATVLACVIRVARRRRRLLQLSACLLAPIVPGTPVMLKLLGWLILRDFRAATILATAMFGVAVSATVIPMVANEEPRRP
jgi:hypothetical protein